MSYSKLISEEWENEKNRRKLTQGWSNEDKKRADFIFITTAEIFFLEAGAKQCAICAASYAAAALFFTILMWQGHAALEKKIVVSISSLAVAAVLIFAIYRLACILLKEFHFAGKIEKEYAKIISQLEADRRLREILNIIRVQSITPRDQKYGTLILQRMLNKR